MALIGSAGLPFRGIVVSYPKFNTIREVRSILSLGAFSSEWLAGRRRFYHP